MIDPEFKLPAETAEMRRSSAVEIFLGSEPFEPDRTLGVEFRILYTSIGGKGSVQVSQCKESPEDTRALNLVSLMGKDTEGKTRLYFASWYMGEDDFVGNTFPYEDDIEQILHEAKWSLRRTRHGEA